jgi:antitoxin (DNA-binding transcriptional repressor) of toxin-antitoxin stability system
MPTINMRQLRDTRQLKIWLKAGKTVELHERNKPVGRIVPAQEPVAAPKEWPDFAARRKKIFGDKVFDLEEIFLRDRHRD